MIEGSARLIYPGKRNRPESVEVVFEWGTGTKWSKTYGTPGDSGTHTTLQMPYWDDSRNAYRKAEEVYKKAQFGMTLEFTSFDNGLLRSIGDVATVTNADLGLSAVEMALIENEPIARGRWRRKYLQYDDTAYSNSDPADDDPPDTLLNNPNRPPNGPTPTLTYVGFGAASPQTESCIQIVFTGVTWPYTLDYYVTVTTTADLTTILYSAYVTPTTDSPNVYTLLTDFAAARGESPQVTYIVNVYVRSITSTDVYDVLSETPGTAQITDPAVPDGPTPTLTAELVTSASPNYYRIKIEFPPINWVYLQDYKVNVYIEGASPQTILHSEYVAAGSETGSPLTITVYADLSDSPGFQMDIGNSPQTVYRVDVYARADWTGPGASEVLSDIPGTATVTDPIEILWNTDPITSFYFTTYGGTAAPGFEFRRTDSSFGNQSSVRWNYSAQAIVIDPLTSAVYDTDQLICMYDNVVEIHGNDSATLMDWGLSGAGVWVKANAPSAQASLTVLDQTANSPQREGQVYSCDLHVAWNDGAGAPLAGTIKTKPVTIIAWADQAFIVIDSFTGTNGTNLTAHAPDTPAAVSPSGWEAMADGFEIQSNGAEALRTSSPLPTYSMAVLDTGLSNAVWYAIVNLNDEDIALVGRVQDASNYWQLLVEGASGSSPVLKLNEVNAGVATTRASVTMTGKGPIGTTAGRLIRLSFNGNDILGAFIFRNASALAIATGGVPGNSVFEVTYNSASFNTETRFGIQSAGGTARWDAAFAVAEEAAWITTIE